MRCLSRRPKERFNNVTDLAGALADFGPEHARFAVEAISELLPHTESEPPRSMVDVAAEPAAPIAPSTGDTTVYLPGKGGGGGRSWLVLSAVAVVTFALGTGFGWVMGLPTGATGLPSRPVAQARPAAPVPSAAPAAPQPEVAPSGTVIDLDAPATQPRTRRAAAAEPAKLDEGLPPPAAAPAPESAPQKTAEPKAPPPTPRIAASL
jgi:hypothetical protein